MYDTDQALREYTLFKTYNKAITDSLENLPQNKTEEYILANNFKSDSLGKRINEQCILPIDILNIERIIELIKIYGFPSKNRIEKIYKKDLDDKHLSRCEYGHMTPKRKKKHSGYA